MNEYTSSISIEPLPSLGEERITRQMLFSFFVSKLDDPQLQDRFDFVDQVSGYTHLLPDGPNRVEVKTTSAQVADRLGLICDVLTGLTSRNDDGEPVFSISNTYNAFSVIATNWLSIHGCLGGDGHGRSTVWLLPLTLHLAGHSNHFSSKEFFDGEGNFDINKAKWSLIFLTPNFCGLRLAAAVKELDDKGDINTSLLDRRIIGDSECRKKANAYAMQIVFRSILSKL